MNYDQESRPLGRKADQVDSRRVVAVISVFGAPRDLPDRARALLSQVDDVVLVDDGSSSLAPLGLNGDGLHSISLPENGGIAKALNVAIQRARELKATHVLTLDQDSELLPGHVSRLIDLIDAAVAGGVRVAAGVPGVVGGAPVLRDSDGRPFDPIQSGQVVPVETFEALGGFTERLFIDAVDSDFTVRAHTAGFEFVMDDELEMAHALGELVPITVFGKQLVLAGRPRHVLYHSPMRTYYMVRNSRWLARTYRECARDWMRFRNRKLAEMVLGGSLLAPDRWKQLRAIRAGWKDALDDRLGKIPEDVLALLR